MLFQTNIKKINKNKYRIKFLNKYTINQILKLEMILSYYIKRLNMG